MKGYFTLGIKSNGNTQIHVFWNNVPHQDIYEITPGHSFTIVSTENKDQYFNFIARDKDGPSRVEDRGKVRIYINSQIKCNIYLSNDQKLDSKSLENLNENFKWKTNFGIEGGIHLVEISPKDPDYCINCIYYGFIESVSAGSIQIFVSIEHLNQPMMLTGGQTYPEILRGKEHKIYQFYNGDKDEFSISITVQTGLLRIFVGSS